MLAFKITNEWSRMGLLAKTFDVATIFGFTIGLYVIAYYGLSLGLVAALTAGIAGFALAILGIREMDFETRFIGAIFIAFMVGVKWLMVELF